MKFNYKLTFVNRKFVMSIKIIQLLQLLTMTTTTNATQAPAKAAIVLNQANGEANVSVSTKKEEETNNPAKPVDRFAKNTRYSIYNNGGGYTGL